MLDVGALMPLSTADWPGKLAAVVYLHGCPWECVDCPQPSLRPRPDESAIPWTAVMDFLEQRRGLLDAVVFSGGEPTLQAGLGKAMEQVHGRGFLVGLETAGIYPRRLAQVLPACDWVGFEVKGPFADYPELIGRSYGAGAAAESLEMVVRSGVPYEVRTTWNPLRYSAQALLGMATDLAARGVRTYALQLDAAPLDGEDEPPDPALLAEMARRFERFTCRKLSVTA
jgi:pyruvate formate lyase activating enzyme